MAVNKVIYAGNTLIDLTQDTVSADKLLSGCTAHDSAGVLIHGSYSPSSTRLIIITESGNQVTAKNGSTTLTGVSQGAYSFDIPYSGVWNVTATFGVLTSSASVTISSDSQYVVELNVGIELENASWAAIKSAAQSGSAASIWSIGDTKSFSDGSYSLEAEIVDINRGGNNIWFDIKLPKFQREMWDGEVTLFDWLNRTYYYTLPKELRTVTGQLQLIEYGDIFGSTRFQLFETTAGRTKGVSWWLGTSRVSGPTPETSYYYYCTSDGSSSTANIFSSLYINYKFVIS